MPSLFVAGPRTTPCLLVGVTFVTMTLTEKVIRVGSAGTSSDHLKNQAIL
jgi:hypothetical protein